MRLPHLALLALFLAPHGTSQEADRAARPVQVFVLAGQSNMEGKGFPEPLAWQVTQPEYQGRWTRFVADGDFDAFTRTLEASLAKDPGRPEYAWSVREDVWVSFLDRHGPLTVGYGVPHKGFGPELGFGHVLGEHLDEQVLIVKTAWGGKSLGRDFLPPSAEQPTDEELERIAAERTARERERAEKQGRDPGPAVSVAAVRAEYGHFYRAMLAEVRAALNLLGEHFAAYGDRGWELAGFVWFQGWNDQFDAGWSRDYEENLAALIRDVRKELDAPRLPFVVGQVGFDGSNEPQQDREGEPTPRTRIQAAQAAVGDRPELRGSVAVVETARFWDREADAIYRGEGGWQADVERWRRFGNDRPYHYYGSPWFFAQAGEAFGQAMVGLLD